MYVQCFYMNCKWFNFVVLKIMNVKFVFILLLVEMFLFIWNGVVCIVCFVGKLQKFGDVVVFEVGFEYCDVIGVDLIECYIVWQVMLLMVCNVDGEFIYEFLSFVFGYIYDVCIVVKYLLFMFYGIE